MEQRSTTRYTQRIRSGPGLIVAAPAVFVLRSALNYKLPNFGIFF